MHRALILNHEAITVWHIAEHVLEVLIVAALDYLFIRRCGGCRQISSLLRGPEIRRGRLQTDFGGVATEARARSEGATLLQISRGPVPLHGTRKSVLSSWGLPGARLEP